MIGSSRLTRAGVAALLALWPCVKAQAQTPVRVKDIAPGATSGLSSRSSAVLNDVLYFAANDGIAGVELWRSDGSEAGTYMVKDINAGPNPSGPQQFTLHQGTVYFVAYDGTSTLADRRYRGGYDPR